MTIWDRIRVYHWYSDNSIKLLGDRACERSKYEERIIRSILEDSKTPNVGAFIVLRGCVVSLYRNGIKFYKGEYVNPDETYVGEDIQKIARIYGDFKKNAIVKDWEVRE